MTKTSILTHVKYLTWACKVVAAANRNWRERRPYRGDVLMERDGLHYYLFTWCVEEELIEDPGVLRKHPHSFYVSQVFADHPALVKQEARRYWQTLVKAYR